MPMPSPSLTRPLLGDQPRHEDSATSYHYGEKPTAKTVRFRDPIADTEPTIPSQQAYAPKSILKKNLTPPTLDLKSEITEIDPSTAGIIRKIQQKYRDRNPLVAQKKNLKLEREILAEDASCCQKLGCACCVTTTISGIAAAATSISAASCSPWSALLAIPCCLTFCFWKKSNDNEKKIRAKIQDEKAIDLALNPPQQMMPK